MAADSTFSRLVSLACHDLRTPLATAHGFARTLDRLEPLQERTRRYIGLIAAASAEMADLLDRLSLVAQIEGDRYKPSLRTVDSFDLARSAAMQVEAGSVDVAGEGAAVSVDKDWTERSLAAYAECAIRHGDSDRLSIAVAGAELRFSPVTPASGPILIGEELRDLGAAVAGRVIEATGGSVELDDGALVVGLPAT